MSSTSQPVPPHRFAEAINELPLSNLYSKAAEIRNSISHLQSSNLQLLSFADDGDTDCAEALQENGVVIQRMEERLRLVKAEVEVRGFVWEEGEKPKEETNTKINGLGHDERPESIVGETLDTEQKRGVVDGTNDSSLASRFTEALDGKEEDGGTADGVHV